MARLLTAIIGLLLRICTKKFEEEFLDIDGVPLKTFA